MNNFDEDYDAAEFLENQQMHEDAIDDEDAHNISEAQKNLNFYPDNCDPFWDSPDGQETLQIAKQFNLSPTVSNEKRKRIYSAARSAALEE